MKSLKLVMGIFLSIFISPSFAQQNNGMRTNDAIKNLNFDYEWIYKGAGNSLGISIKINNNNNYFIKDLKISCDMIAPSGTIIGTVENDLLVKIDANKKYVNKKFLVGFINSQTEKVNCEISYLKTEPRLKSLGLN